MRAGAPLLAAASLAFPLLAAGCGAREAARMEAPVASFLTDDLVQVHLAGRGAPPPGAVRAAADCAAAELVALRSGNFARHVRTAVAEEGGNWRADAVYTVSAALPRGPGTIDADVVAAACREREF